MSRRHAETYTSVRRQIEETLANKDFSKNLYQSTEGITRILDAILTTKGEDWAAHVVDEQGQPLLTESEQREFTIAFQDHIYAVLNFLGATGRYGEEQDPTTIPGRDDIYEKFMGRIRSVNQTVQNYASQHGVLKLEKESEWQPDSPLIPEPVRQAPFQGVPTHRPNLDKLNPPFRTIVFAVYMALDVARISMAVSGRDTGQKILSILVSLLDLLRGDWKKSILSFIGYFGMSPLLYGEFGKVFLTAFSMFSPPLQDTMILGSLDATKSFLVGLLLAIFQVTAPEEVRLPLIGALERVAQHKAKMDGALESEGLSARPDYLAPTFEDLNNLQAVISDPAYLCSCEFQNMVDAVNRSSTIRVVLQLLRIPVTTEYKENKCGKGPCKPFVETVVNSAQEEKREEPLTEQNLQQSVSTPNTIRQGGRAPIGRLIHARTKRSTA